MQKQPFQQEAAQVPKPHTAPERAHLRSASFVLSQLSFKTLWEKTRAIGPG